jgi:hypothetical protein
MGKIFADVTNASVDYNSVLGSGGSDDDAITAAVATSPAATLTASDPGTVSGNEVTV